MTATALDVERTARDTTTAQWCVAGVVMLGSMAAGGFAFHYLGEPWPLGVLIALAVDLALAAWLRIGPRLRAVGVTSRAGWALEIMTAAQTLYLNIGAAVFRNIDQGSVAAHWLLGIAHSFLPVDMLMLGFAGADAHLKLLRVKRNRETQDRAEREARLDVERTALEAQRRERLEIEERRANGELVDATDKHREAQRLREQAKREADEAERLREVAQQERAAAETETAATRAIAEKLAAQRKPAQRSAAPRGKKPAADPDTRRQWIREQRALGRNPTGAEVDREFGPPNNGWRLVKQIEEEIAAEMDAELVALTGANHRDEACDNA